MADYTTTSSEIFMCDLKIVFSYNVNWSIDFYLYENLLFGNVFKNINFAEANEFFSTTWHLYSLTFELVILIIIGTSTLRIFLVNDWIVLVIKFL